MPACHPVLATDRARLCPSYKLLWQLTAAGTNQSILTFMMVAVANPKL